MILTILYLLLVLALVGWKGWHAWLRGRSTYQQDMQHHGSLREYLLGNGATEWQSKEPSCLAACLHSDGPSVAFLAGTHRVGRFGSCIEVVQLDFLT